MTNEKKSDKRTSHRSKRSQATRRSWREGKFGKKTEMADATPPVAGKVIAENRKEKKPKTVKETEEGLVKDFMDETEGYRIYAKQSKDPNLTIQEQEKLARIGAQEAGHRNQLAKILEKRAKGKDET